MHTSRSQKMELTEIILVQKQSWNSCTGPVLWHGRLSCHLLCRHTSIPYGASQILATLLPIKLPANTWEDDQVLGPCYPCEISRQYSRLLALTRLSPNCHSYLRNKWPHRGYLCHSAFQINLSIYKRYKFFLMYISDQLYEDPLICINFNTVCTKIHKFHIPWTSWSTFTLYSIHTSTISYRN